MKGFRYYLVNYVPFYYEVDRWIKKKVLQVIKRRHLKR